MTKHTPYEPNLKEICDRYPHDEDIQNLVYVYRLLDDSRTSYIGEVAKLQPCDRCGHALKKHFTPGSECVFRDENQTYCDCSNYRKEPTNETE